jgi:hypothetical protein
MHSSGKREYMTAIVIDESGEVIDEIREGDRIIRGTSIDLYNNTIELNKNDSFIKIYTKCMFELSNDISGKESILLTYLLQFVSYQTGILTHSNGVCVTRDYIAKDIKQDKRTVDRTLDGLIRKKILGKHRTGKVVCYIVNPYIFMKGNRINKTLAKLFEHSKWNK